MDGQPLIPENESNEEAGLNPNLQPNSPTPLPYNDQNNDSQISLNTSDMEVAPPQLVENFQQASGFILPSQLDFSKYTNLNELNHMRINQIDDITFII